ncbi:MAG: DUF4114 domain-containing protein [Ferruginibacter sp.]|nr:DUF4114 domain-containing protein [Cytophagales bacterium]
MKTKNYVLLWVVFLMSVSCKKEEPVTRAVEFTSTNYQTLGTYDSLGKPNYLLTRDVISPTLLSFIKDALPDKTDLRTTNPELLTTSAIADIVITQQSDVFITFVSQNGAATNTFAFYTYPTNQPPVSTKDIKEITYVFPNSGKGTPLQQGDKVRIGRFDVGTSVGFVLLQKAWDSTTNTVDNKSVHFCSNDVLNPEVDPNLKKHAVLIDYPSENKVLIGFEDLNRTNPNCDHDFNDVVFFCTVIP